MSLLSLRMILIADGEAWACPVGILSSLHAAVKHTKTANKTGISDRILLHF